MNNENPLRWAGVVEFLQLQNNNFPMEKQTLEKDQIFFLLDMHAKLSSFIILASFVVKPKPLLAEASIVRLFMAFLKSLLKLDGDRHF